MKRPHILSNPLHHYYNVERIGFSHVDFSSDCADLNDKHIRCAALSAIFTGFWWKSGRYVGLLVSLMWSI